MANKLAERLANRQGVRIDAPDPAPPGDAARPARLQGQFSIDALDHEGGLDSHQISFLPRVRRSCMKEMTTTITKNMVALAIW